MVVVIVDLEQNMIGDPDTDRVLNPLGFKFLGVGAGALAKIDDDIGVIGRDRAIARVSGESQQVRVTKVPKPDGERQTRVIAPCPFLDGYESEFRPHPADLEITTTFEEDALSAGVADLEFVDESPGEAAANLVGIGDQLPDADLVPRQVAEDEGDDCVAFDDDEQGASFGPLTVGAVREEPDG